MKLRRRINHKLWITFTLVAVVIAVVPLVAVVADTVYLGIGSVNLKFFTSLPPAPCSVVTRSATGGTATTLVDTSQFWVTNQWAGYPVSITGGTDVGQSGTIISNTANTLTISGKWTSAPSSTVSSTAIRGTTTNLTDNSRKWTVNQWAGDMVNITSGTDAGKSATVISNTAHTLTFSALPSAPGTNFLYTLGGPSMYVIGCASGGLGDAVQGTLILVALSSGIGIPIGVISGIYISEYGRKSLYGSLIRFMGDVAAGIPSIVTGVLFFILLVIPMRGYTATAASIALGSMMIPIVANTSAEALKTVPNSIREASEALGIRKWRTVLLMVANAKRGIATGTLLAIARITGETAPLILTAGSSVFWFSGLGHPIASLTYSIFYYGTSAYPNWKSLAWGAALVLIIIVMGINVMVRIMTRSKRGLV
ncbi:MAG: phosphate ABC transporter permease PstA [Nitrososphaerales archaeon]